MFPYLLFLVPFPLNLAVQFTKKKRSLYKRKYRKKKILYTIVFSTKYFLPIQKLRKIIKNVSLRQNRRKSFYTFNLKFISNNSNPSFDFWKLITLDERNSPDRGSRLLWKNFFDWLCFNDFIYIYTYGLLTRRKKYKFG